MYSQEFGGHLPGLPDAARGEDDGRRVEHDESSGFPPVAEGAGEAGARLVLEQAGDRELHEYVDPEAHRPLLQGADHLQAGAVANVGQPGVAVPTEVPLADKSVGRPVEERAPLLEFPHPVGCFFGVEFGHPPVVEELAAAHGVPKVDLPVVLRPKVAHGGRDAALRHDGVGLAEQALADDRRPGSGIVGGDGRPEAGPAGADHDDVVIVTLVLAHRDSLPLRRIWDR